VFALYAHLTGGEMDRDIFEDCEAMASKHGLDLAYLERDGQFVLVASSSEVGYGHVCTDEVDPEWHQTQFVHATRMLCEKWFHKLDKLIKRSKNNGH
jgi:nucleoside-diphosphate-sugar epimerase